MPKKAQKYTVDWFSDAAFPQIVKATEGGESLSACKREIVSRAQNLIDHWKTVARAARRATANGMNYEE